MPPGTVYLVEDVVVSPFEEADKEMFIRNYLAKKSSKEALLFYKGNTYDVILLVFDIAQESGLVHMGIRSYALEKGVRYSFPMHSE